MVHPTEEALKIFQEASVPRLVSAGLVDGSKSSTKINVVWEQDDLIELKKKKFSLQYEVDSEIRQYGFPTEKNPEIILEASSASKTKCAVIKRININGKTEPKFVLEIWSNRKCKISFNLSSLNIHGNVHDDIFFSAFSWDEKETRLMYVAEQKPEDCAGRKYRFEESWGEKLYEITKPIICVFDTVSEKLYTIHLSNSDIISPMQPQWGTDNSIIFCGLKRLPYRLGKFYCENRPCDIFVLTLDEEYKEVSLINITETHSGISSNWCPRLNQSHSKVVYLHSDLFAEGSPHVSYAEIYYYDLVNKTTHEIPNNTGIEYYIKNFPSSIWFSDETHIAVHEKNALLIINTQNGDIVFSLENCTSLVGVERNFALLSMSSLNSTKTSFAAYDHNRKKFFAEEEISHPFTKEKVYVQNVPNVYSWGLIPNLNAKKIPLVVWAHGGPHTIFEDAYNNFTTGFCLLGYSVLMVNYTGSVGFGDKFLSPLPGNIGTQDVNEVHSMVKSFIEKHDQIDSNNIFYFGGSHGGFIGAHLMGQYPNFYRAAVLRNPVIDIAAMSTVTDIPDWCYFECGLPFNQGKIPCGNDYVAMLSKSPIIHVPEITAPILLCIGGKDERVPPSQGKAFYRLLKGNNKKVEMLFYPNGSHPLKKTEVIGDYFVNSADWFYQHLKL